MASLFASRDMLIKVDDRYCPVTICVHQPTDGGDGVFQSHVKFSNVEKYNAIIKGADGINCLECALGYINNICRDSGDPKFFWDENEPYQGSNVGR